MSEDFSTSLGKTYEALADKVPLDSLSDEAKSAVIGHLLNSSIAAHRLQRELKLIDAQIEESEATTKLKEQQKLSLKFEDGIKEAQLLIDSKLKDAQIEELMESAKYKTRQTTGLDDAVRRDTAKIVCEALGIMKSSGNNAGAWWEVASKSINALAGETLSEMKNDPE